jgi:hypothetical protein
MSQPQLVLLVVLDFHHQLTVLRQLVVVAVEVRGE